MAKKGEAKSRHLAAETPSPQSPNVRSNLSEVVSSRTRLELKVVDAKLLKVQVLDISYWKHFPNLAKLVADALLRGVVPLPSPASRRVKVEDLKAGFYRFLVKQAEPKIGSLDLDTTLFNLFIDDLGEKKSDGSYRYSTQTRLKRLGALKSLIQRMAELGAKLPEDSSIRRNPWPDGTSDRYKTKPKSVPEFVRLANQCAADVVEITNDVRELRRAMLSADKEIKRTEAYGPKSIGQTLAWLRWRFDGIMPERQDLIASHPHLRGLIDGYGYGRLCRAFHPRIQDLAPFFLCLACDSLYNSQPIAELSLSDKSEHVVAGQRKFLLEPYKTRAGRTQPRSFPIDMSDPTNPAALWAFMVDWTREIRARCNKPWKNHLFLYVCRNRKGAVEARSMMDQQSRSMSHLEGQLRSYLKSAALPPAGTRTIRATGISIARNVLNLGPIEILALSGQKSLETLERHYRDAVADQKDQEAIADVMNSRAAYISTRGSFDPRSAGSTPSLGATPGWGCLDVFHSPIPGEVEGRRCEAVGMCPACPLAFQESDKPANYVRCLQLKSRLEESRQRLGEITWQVRWSASYDGVMCVYIPAFSAEVRRAAESVHLGSFPLLD